MSTIFNNFIHGENSDVSVTGSYAGPSNVRIVIHSYCICLTYFLAGNLAQRRYPIVDNRDRLA